jgi:hypothetical protein
MRAVLKIAVVSITVVGTLNAATIKLYQDKETGAIFTKEGKNRVYLGEFISKDEFEKVFTKKAKKELKTVSVFSKVPKIKINGVHYFGFTAINYENPSKEDINKFESRRNYLQFKGYWNDKDYIRITFDTFLQYADTNSKDVGSWLVRLKYAYIYLNNILPNTSVEIGQAHRPWIDWEEHHSWLYRSVAKSFIEESNGAHLSNSSDLGINFKTKTQYISSEIGVYNGEGYHDKTANYNKELSFEWRVTAHIIGDGKAQKNKEYADISFFGQINPDFKNDSNVSTVERDLNWFGIHGVYNNPLFLLGGMYCVSDNNNGEYEGNGWSINGEARITKKISLFGRFDKWNVENREYDRNEWLAGASYVYNKNLKFIGNVFVIDPNDNISNDKESRYMLTTEAKW